MWVVVALFAASCASPEPPGEWAVQRVSPPDEEIVVADPTICDDIRTLATGSHAAETELDPTLDELARISAVVGATAALPLISDVRALEGTDGSTELEIAALRHDALLGAAAVIDDATAALCAVPAFSALYATSGFPECHFPMEIAVGAYTTVGEPGSCRAEGRPDFLPCWSTDGTHLPLDCVSGEIVRAFGTRWDTAGPPTPFVLERPEPAIPEGPPIVAPTEAPECADLAGLFLDRSVSEGSFLDFAELAFAAADLDAATRRLVAEFVEAAEVTPSFAEFEALVSELDRVTATTCGLPIVSAAASLGGGIDQLPCWTPTGIPYPSYETIACEAA